eukprot:symbB.v1.2.014927.t1/scaffold1103.1/size137753/3
MATRKSASQLFQLVILLSLLVWQCVKLEKQETVSLAEAYGIEPTGVQWPFVVAATIFLMEFLLCFLLLLLLRLMLYFKDPGSGEVLFLSRLREVAEMLAFISFFSGVYYIFQVCRKHDHESPMGSGSLFRDTREVREGRHMLLWTLLAPQQWVMHARLYTKASWQEAGNLMISTAFTMVFGLCASQAPGDEFPMGHPGTPPRMPGRYDADRCLDPTTLAGSLLLSYWLLMFAHNLCTSTLVEHAGFPREVQSSDRGL